MTDTSVPPAGTVVPPYWFNQRQGKTEAAGPNTYKLTAPNLKPAFIQICPGENGRWSAALRLDEEGPDIATTEAEFQKPEEAWDAAFELYRVQVVV